VDYSNDYSTLENKENMNSNQSYMIGGTPVITKGKVMLPPIKRVPSLGKYRPIIEYKPPVLRCAALKPSSQMNQKL
jgi:hypothetical protein